MLPNEIWEEIILLNVSNFKSMRLNHYFNLLCDGLNKRFCLKYNYDLIEDYKKSFQVGNTLTRFIKNLKRLLPIISDNIFIDIRKQMFVGITIPNLYSSKTLWLDDFNLSQLPKEIAYLSNLTSLALHYNQLSQLPKEFKKLKQLISIDLSDNLFTVFPECILKLNNLSHLWLRNNKIITLPDLSGLNLQMIDLRNNPLMEFILIDNPLLYVTI